MSLPWQEKPPGDAERFIIVNIVDNEIIGFSNDEDEVIKMAMREVTLGKKDIEVYEATGFSAWKRNLKK